MRSVQKRPWADILPVRSRASLVNKRFINYTTEESFEGFSQIPCTTAGSFGTMPGPILREYCMDWQ